MAYDLRGNPMNIPENLIPIAPGVWVDPNILPTRDTPPPTAQDHANRSDLLAESHPMWDVASGGSRNRPGTTWTMEDLTEAAVLLDAIEGKKAGAFFDLLLAEPGRLLTSDDIISAAPDTFTSAYAIAGSLNGFRKHVERAGRAYPFYWWEGTDNDTPTRYAVRPSVASVFNAARRSSTT